MDGSWLLSSLEITSTSLFSVATIFAAAYPGFFDIRELSKPACLALCISRYPPTPHIAVKPSTTTTTPPRIHTTRTFDFFAGGKAVPCDVRGKGEGGFRRKIREAS